MGFSEKAALIIFIKNPVMGRVKTRLAKTVGDMNALRIYHFLLANTREVIEDIKCEKLVFYDKFIPAKDEWSDDEFQKFLQKGDGLGEKLKNSFKAAFDEEYDKVIMIWPDCPKLRTFIVETAFRKLNSVDFVIGGTEDGSFYMLGMKKFTPEIFERKTWGTSTVYQDMIEDFKKMNAAYFDFPVLRDVDT
jgi:uncharacterized protein